MLEKLADHDDTLLEQLLMDQIPDRTTVYADLAKDTGAGQIVPVLFGSALNDFGVRRLLKALRHEVPDPAAAAARLGAEGQGPCAFVFKVSNSGAMGRLHLRPRSERQPQGRRRAEGTGGDAVRVGTLFAVQGEKTVKLRRGKAGDDVAGLRLGELGGLLALHREQRADRGHARRRCSSAPGLPSARRRRRGR